MKLDIITIDGASGNCNVKGLVPTVQPEMLLDIFQQYMKWADLFRKLKVIQPTLETENGLVITARELGAEGIGYVEQNICFLMKNRILSVRQMILSKSK